MSILWKLWLFQRLKNGIITNDASTKLGSWMMQVWNYGLESFSLWRQSCWDTTRTKIPRVKPLYVHMDVVNCELDKWWYFHYFHCHIQLWAPHTHTHTHALPPSLLTLTIFTWNLAIKSTHCGTWRIPSQTCKPSSRPAPKCETASSSFQGHLSLGLPTPIYHSFCPKFFPSP